VLRAPGGEEERVGARIEGIGHVAQVKDEPANLLAQWRPARLAGEDGVPAMGAEPLGEVAGGGRLARSVGALDGDEAAALGRRSGHVGGRMDVATSATATMTRTAMSTARPAPRLIGSDRRWG
jgi:hypothetical protein